jgi:hypothetical protein
MTNGMGLLKMSYDVLIDKVTASIMRDFEVRATGVNCVPWHCIVLENSTSLGYTAQASQPKCSTLSGLKSPRVPRLAPPSV